MEGSKWLDWDLEEFPYYTMGVSHICIEKETGKEYELMFYDFDGNVSDTDIETILEAFPNDCLLFKTNRGFHFISLCISYRNNTTKKAYKLSKKLEQDYNLKKYKYLSLRILPKYHFWGEKYCKGPEFIKVLKKPKEHSICSLSHLRIYEKMGISEKVLREYEKCYFKIFGIKLKVYMCRH